MTPTSNRKYCPRCRKEKEFSEFGKDRTAADRLQNVCKSCRADYYIANRERCDAYGKLRYARARAEAFPDREKYQLRFKRLEKEFREKYPKRERPPRIRPPKPKKSAEEILEEKRKRKQQEYEEMFNRILDYQKTNW